jgi:lipopolysaccharide export LptBFGC system permease protein LptF
MVIINEYFSSMIIPMSAKIFNNDDTGDNENRIFIIDDNNIIMIFIIDHTGDKADQIFIIHNNGNNEYIAM